MNTSEQEEKKYLNQILIKINKSIAEIDDRVETQLRDINEAKAHLQEHKRDMDHLEKNAIRESVGQIAMMGDAAVSKKRRLHRLRDIPYFGRFDFLQKGRTKNSPIYVGVHNFTDEEKNENLIFDWRAPISSIFYDFELGEAFFHSKTEKVEGEVTRKRQYRIRRGKMEYMIESDLTIQDDLLQKELNRASSTKMKNIVATIQREQNAIIRNENAYNLIIQGVAGSGKTSIALHRIAYLLYKQKDTISSEEILIISPNKVFASYISNVLPELGEESVEETSMEELANRLLEYEIQFQGFFEQVSELLDNPPTALLERIRVKSSLDFLRKMDEYLLHLENKAFDEHDITISKKVIPGWFIREKFEQYNRFPILKRFNEIGREVVASVNREYGYEITGKERTELQQTIRKMFPSTNLRTLYKKFYEWLGNPKLLKMRKGGQYEYSDVYPFIYLKFKLEGIQPLYKVKHLIIDEMQDYSAVQYQVINRIFPCRKTILGDINQSVNPFSSSNLEVIQQIISNSDCMTMLKSYRSTYEITEFTKKIKKGVLAEPIERHGNQPVISGFTSIRDEIDQTLNKLVEFEESDHNSIGIICKTQEQADTLHSAIKERRLSVDMLDAASASFSGGKVLTTAHLAKGLEFDQVIVPFVSDTNYKTEADLQMLYVACTRAMHELNLSFTGKLTDFLKN